MDALSLGGGFTTVGVGLWAASGLVDLAGTLNNAAATLALNATSGPWNLRGGGRSRGRRRHLRRLPALRHHRRRHALGRDAGRHARPDGRHRRLRGDHRRPDARRRHREHQQHRHGLRLAAVRRHAGPRRHGGRLRQHGLRRRSTDADCRWPPPGRR